MSGFQLQMRRTWQEARVQAWHHWQRLCHHRQQTRIESNKSIHHWGYFIAREILTKGDRSLGGSRRRRDRNWAHSQAILSPQDHLMPHPQGFSPIPSKNLCPQTHHSRRGCHQAPGGGWFHNSPDTGVIMEKEPPATPGRGGDDKGQQGTVRAGPEGGTRCWSLGLGHIFCTLASAVRCAGCTEYACRCCKQPLVPCELLWLYATLVPGKPLILNNQQFKKIWWDRLFKINYFILIGG